MSRGSQLLFTREGSVLWSRSRQGDGGADGDRDAVSSPPGTLPVTCKVGRLPRVVLESVVNPVSLPRPRPAGPETRSGRTFSTKLVERLIFPATLCETGSLMNVVGLIYS